MPKPTLSTLETATFAFPDFAALQYASGHLVTGRYHDDAFLQAQARGIYGPYTEGFVLTDGSFITREEGMEMLRRLARRTCNERAAAAVGNAERQEFLTTEDVRYALG